VATQTVARGQRRAPELARRRPRRFWATVRYHALTAFAALALLYLLIPIAVVMLFSFNDPTGKFNFVFEQFSLAAWRDPLGVAGLQDAVVLSLELAALSTIIATAIGTLMALALVRYSFRGRSATSFLIFLPMATPEIVMGSSLLALFISINLTRGFTTLLIAHVLFNISFVVVTVKARIIGFDRQLEEAAMDLYANEWQTFRRITLPLIAPGVGAAALLAFALSIDDFVISQFNSGSKVTFPLYIYGAARVGVPVQVNVIGSMIFLVAVTLMVGSVLSQRRRASTLGTTP
jgi:spermidine/putrescine transport system permease protein